MAAGYICKQHAGADYIRNFGFSNLQSGIDTRKLWRGGVFAWHWHSQVEFLYVEKGEVTCCVNTSSIRLREHEGIFINSKESHSILRNVGVGYIKTILFPAEFVFDTNNHFCKECIRPIAHQEQYQYIRLTGEKEWQRDVLSEMEKLYHYCEKNIAKKMSDVIFSVCRIWENLTSFQQEIPVTDPSQTRSPSQIRLQQLYRHFRITIATEMVWQMRLSP